MLQGKGEEEGIIDLESQRGVPKKGKRNVVQLNSGEGDQRGDEEQPI